MPRSTLIDAAYAAATGLSNDSAEEIIARMERDGMDLWSESKYVWHRRTEGTSSPGTLAVAQTQDMFLSGAGSGSDSTAVKPSADPVAGSEKRGPSSLKQWEDLIGYESSFLAELLSPKPALCHQKFELVVDELAFVGHPVHAKEDGSWMFSELSGQQPSGVGDSPEGGAWDGYQRGRIQNRPAGNFIPGRSLSQQPRHIFQLADDGEDGDTEETPPIRPLISHSKTYSRSVSVHVGANSSSTSPISRRVGGKQAITQLESFHLVLVLDRPDPSSVASTDLDRYIDAFYHQFAFKLTAAMLYEQGHSNFIAQEAQMLLALRDRCLVSLHFFVRIASEG
jgi:hypothetical protein